MRRTVADRASAVSPLVWIVLGVAVVLLFIGLMAAMALMAPLGG
jgi:hypothetical protein